MMYRIERNRKATSVNFTTAKAAKRFVQDRAEEYPNDTWAAIDTSDGRAIILIENGEAYIAL